MNDAQLFAVAERFGTPTYVYDGPQVAAKVAELRAALPEAGLLYAVKANPNGALLRRLAALGVGAEVIGLGELERAHRAGIPPQRILLGGPRQDAALIARALELGVGWVSLDSASQWQLWEAAGAAGMRFLVRLNPALDPRTHEHLATGAAESKFGMLYPEARAVAEAVAARARLAGFHVHAGSQIREISVYDEILEQLGGLYRAFAGLSTLDLGGGFAVPGFPLSEFAARARRFARAQGVQLLLEPGRFLVAEAGVLLSRVLHVKEGALRHLIADAGMADLLRPALYGAEHPIRVLGRAGEGPLAEVDGPLCENADRLGRARALPEVAPGDLLAVEQAGAYGMAMASNYASSLRPAEVLVEGEALRLVREREHPEDLWRLERA